MEEGAGFKIAMGAFDQTRPPVSEVSWSRRHNFVSICHAAFILSKVDYCNVALSGLPKCDIDRLQSVINAAAHLTSDLCRYDHVTPLLNDLHWLRVPERITYKLCVLSSLHGAAVFTRNHSACCRTNISRRRLRSASSSALVVPATRRSSLGDRAFAVAGPRAWTVYLSSSLTARHFSPSRNISRLTYLVYLFRARFDCVKRPCSSLGRLRRYNFVKLHYIT